MKQFGSWMCSRNGEVIAHTCSWRRQEEEARLVAKSTGSGAEASQVRLHKWHQHACHASRSMIRSQQALSEACLCFAAGPNRTRLRRALRSNMCQPLWSWSLSHRVHQHGEGVSVLHLHLHIILYMFPSGPLPCCSLPRRRAWRQCLAQHNTAAMTGAISLVRPG